MRDSLKSILYQILLEEFFDDIKDEEELKKRYKELAIKNHPDKGGDMEKMKRINAERDKVLSKLKRDFKSSYTSSYSSTNNKNKKFDVSARLDFMKLFDVSFRLQVMDRFSKMLNNYWREQESQIRGKLISVENDPDAFEKARDILLTEMDKIITMLDKVNLIAKNDIKEQKNKLEKKYQEYTKK